MLEPRCRSPVAKRTPAHEDGGWLKPDPGARAEAARTRRIAHPDARDRGIDHLDSSEAGRDRRSSKSAIRWARSTFSSVSREITVE